MSEKHNELVSVMDGLAGKIREYDTQLQAVRVVLEDLISTTARSKAGIVTKSLESFTAVHAQLNFSEAVLATLRRDRDAAEAALWESDLAEALATQEAALLKTREGRKNTALALEDKARYLRDTGRGALAEESIGHLSSIEILIQDARLREQLSERNYQIAKQHYNNLRFAYNDAAPRVGLKLLEIGANVARTLEVQE